MKVFRLILILAILFSATWVEAKDWKVDDSLTISFLLDETGSMADRKEEVITSFNNYIDSLKENDKKIRFILTKFNSLNFITAEISPSLDSVRLNKENYLPDNFTPLYDAIAKTIKLTEGETVLFVILTDGLENDSTEYTKSEIQELISRKEEEGWTIVYLGANQDAWAEGQSIGIYGGNTFDWDGYTISNAFGVLDGATNVYIDTGCIQTDSFFEEDK